MAISTQTQNLNLIPGKSAPVVVHCSQGNVGDTVQFYLYDGDDPFYPTNVSIAVHGVRADGSVFGPYAVAVTSGSNLVSFELVTAMTSVNGAAIGELVITDSDENQVGSANFGILVEATPYSSSVTYEDDLSIYQRILAYVQSIPAELSGQISAEAEARDTADKNLQGLVASETSARETAYNNLQSQISAEASERATADSNLQSQINQIVAPSGEAPSAAEVQNARIGADGITYANLGTAIRTQFTDVKSLVHSELVTFSDNNYDINLAKISVLQATTNGVTFTAKDGKVTVTGTSTGVAYADLFNNHNTTPFPFIPGKTYELSYEQSDATNLYIQMQYRTSASASWTSLMSSDRQKNSVVFTMPSTFETFVVRMICDASGRTYNKTVSFVIKNAVTSGFGTFDGFLFDAAKYGYADFAKLFRHRDAYTGNYFGVNITSDGDDITLSGTGSYTGTYMLLEDSNNRLFKPGDRIVIEYTDPADNVYIECVTKSGSTTHTPMLQTMHTGVYTLTFPDVFDYVRINLLIINGTAYDTTLTVKVKSANLNNPARTIVVAKDGTGDYTKLKDAVEDAITTYGTTVIVKPGTYDLVAEYGKSYLDSLTDGDFGLMLGNGIVLKFAPNAYVTFNYDGTNGWITQNFSPFNTGNDLGFTIDGMHCTAKYCRYILHDDPRPGVKTRYSYNVIKNCYLEMQPSLNHTDWVNHQIIGGGLSDSTEILIENNIFNDVFTVSDYGSVSYHNSTSGSASYESRIIVKDNYFADGNRLIFEGHGDATEKTKIIVTNNCFKDAAQDIICNPGTPDNMALYSWNNASRG